MKKATNLVKRIAYTLSFARAIWGSLPYFDVLPPLTGAVLWDVVAGYEYWRTLTRSKRCAINNYEFYAVGQGVQVRVNGEWVDATVTALPLLSGGGEWQVKRSDGVFALFAWDDIRHTHKPVQPEPDAGMKAAAQFDVGFPGFE